MLGQCLNVYWTDDHLPLIYGGIGNSFTNDQVLVNPNSSSLPVLAFFYWGRKSLAGLINGAMIFSTLSANNTSLYVASRTLYGLTRDVSTEHRLGRYIHKLSAVVKKTGVPAWSVTISAAAFVWLPFLAIPKGYTIQYVGLFSTLTHRAGAKHVAQIIEIIQISASVSCLIVWLSLSIAYLRYYLW